MKYVGKLFGQIGRTRGYFDTGKTSGDWDALEARASRAEREVERLRAGIGECLRANAHLADGEDCTLIGLKHCLHDPASAPRQSALDATPRHSE
jgi:hypothetical protein